MKTNEIILDNLSMPHSPRIHNEKMYFLHSGKGQLCELNLETKELTTIVSIPGFLRGLYLYKDYALISCSKDRHEGCFRGLELETIINNYSDVKCAVYLVSLTDKKIVSKIVFNDIVEVYDISIMEK